MIQFVNSIRAGHSITSVPECVTNKRSGSLLFGTWRGLGFAVAP
jgi:hypothetical protein